eukprot:TRINITY_DN27867_c0_g1_i6.p1 TRINITY_DN27867_c0_g1~~TRINITY_DN27867_c0_g1_i6.p1  ORF type:complete len:474 (+),score=126.00 TRINITY_DN27867_c0_g1_i6:60-1424(+)
MARPAKKPVTSATKKETVVQNGNHVDENNEDAMSTASGDSTTSTGATKKRGRRPKSEIVPVKKVKLDFRHSRGHGHVLTLGQGDTGQLGLGEDIMEKSRPGIVTTLSNAVDVVAGGMHTLVLTKNGEVFSFGCNDEGSLGRAVQEEEECFVPGKVELEGRIVMITAGDSHSAALTDDGKVFAWGTFRDSSGPIGLTTAGIQKTPLRMFDNVTVKKISSGSDHIVALTTNGEIFTLGNSEQGQLGRVPERFAHRGGRHGLDLLLCSDKLRMNKKTTIVEDAWAGSYNTIVMTDKKEMYVMGLNNYNQLGLELEKGITLFMPTRAQSLEEANIDTLAFGQHHTLLLTSDQAVKALGRSEYGRLGLGDDCKDAEVPTLINSLAKGITEVACGSAVSYAVTEDGKCYSWGMGTNGQLGTGDEDDVTEPNLMKSKQLENRKVIAVSSGGQHTVLIAKDN